MALNATHLFPPPDDEERQSGVITVGSRPTLPSTLFVQNEKASSPTSPQQLRYRNRSAEETASPFNTSNNSTRSSPAYGTPGCSVSHHEGKESHAHHGLSPDSGILGDYPPSPEGQSFGSGQWDRSAYADGRDYVEARQEAGSRHRRRRCSRGHGGLESKLGELFNSPGFGGKIAEKWEELDRVFFANLPLIVLLVVAAGAAFTCLLLSNGIRTHLSAVGGQAVLNGKYASIEFGNRRRRAALEESGRLLPDNIVSEDGEALGGKKAAIQYAHDLKKARKNPPTPEMKKENVDEEIEVLIEKMVGGEEAAEADKAEKKKALLGKLRESGYFTTSKVVEPKVEIPEPEAEIEEEDDGEVTVEDVEEEFEELDVDAPEVEAVEVEVPEFKTPTPRKVVQGPENKVEKRRKKAAEPKKKVKSTEKVLKKRVKKTPPPAKKAPSKKRSSGDQPATKFRIEPKNESQDPVAVASEEDDPFRFN